MVGEKHRLKLRDTNSLVNSAFLPAGWIFCVSSLRKDLQYEEIISHVKSSKHFKT